MEEIPNVAERALIAIEDYKKVMQMGPGSNAEPEAAAVMLREHLAGFDYEQFVELLANYVTLQSSLEFYINVLTAHALRRRVEQMKMTEQAERGPIS